MISVVFVYILDLFHITGESHRQGMGKKVGGPRGRGKG